MTPMIVSRSRLSTGWYRSVNDPLSMASRSDSDGIVERLVSSWTSVDSSPRSTPALSRIELSCEKLLGASTDVLTIVETDTMS